MSGTHLKSNGWRGRLQSKSAPVGSNRWNCENCLDVSSRSSAIVATCGEEGRRAVVSVCMHGRGAPRARSWPNWLELCLKDSSASFNQWQSVPISANHLGVMFEGLERVLPRDHRLLVHRVVAGVPREVRLHSHAGGVGVDELRGNIDSPVRGHEGS